MSQHLGVLVRQLRLERGMGLRELAERANIDSGTLSRLENGKQAGLRGDNLARLAQALGVSATELRRLAGDLTAEERRAILGRPSMEDYLSGDPELTDVQREAIARVYRSYVPRRNSDGD